MESTNFKNRFLMLAVAGVLGGVVSLGGYALLNRSAANSIEGKQNASAQLARYASLNTVPAFDFAGVSAIATPAVVHIKTTVAGSDQSMQQIDPFDFFNNPHFQMPSPGPRSGSGSGVILTDDGYIVTNNHVVDGASKIEVVLNDKRTYVAELVGTDKNTDIAVLHIPENDLPFLKLGNSDDVKVGNWVVAVGNPFNLNSTVTLGIVSALGRNIDLIRSRGNKYAIENFIQTDAAINPGNSGGALINVAGELVGINTAIASETGSYAGYAFAVPVNLVKKVVNDLMKYGKVQRALLGVSIQEINQQLADEKSLSDLKGVYIADVADGGAAQKGGIKMGDVILKINGVEVNSGSKLQEEVGKNKPGDEVTVTLRRKGELKDVKVTLLSEEGDTKVETAARTADEAYLGLKLESTTREERTKLGMKNAVRAVAVDKGVFKDAGMEKGFLITHINNEPVYSAQGAISMLKTLRGAVAIEGKTAAGVEKVLAVKLPTQSE
jgi:serine protease Do